MISITPALKKTITRIITAKPVFVKPGTTKKVREELHLVHLQSSLEELFEDELNKLENSIISCLEKSKLDPISVSREVEATIKRRKLTESQQSRYRSVAANRVNQINHGLEVAIKKIRGRK